MGNEVIKTVLTADSSELRTEFQKAATVARRYHDDMQKSGARALSAARGNLDALRMEAAGHREAADALRAKMSLEEQARKLATQAGISQENAMRILERRVELEKAIAAQQKAAAVDLARRAGIEEQLRATAGQQRKEQEVMARTRESNLAAIAKEQAAASKQAADEKRAREQRIAALPGQGLGGLYATNISPQMLRTMEKHAALSNEIRRQAIRAGQGGYTGAMGFLAFSQAVEDAQYGIRGVLNNIPQMVLGFGGTAGLAGAFSLAAVAGVALYPVLERLYGATDAKRIEKGAEAWRKVYGEAMKVQGAARQEAALQQQVTEFSSRRTREMQDQLRVQDGIISGLETEVARRAEARQLAREIRDAEEALVRARGGVAGQGNGSADRKALEQDERTQKQIRDAANAEVKRLADERAALNSRYGAEAASREKELGELRKRLAESEASVAQQTALLDGLEPGRERNVRKDSLRKSEQARDAVAGAVARLEAEQKAAEAVLSAADAQAAASIETVEQRAVAADKEAEATRRLIEHQEKLNEIRRKTQEAEQGRAAADYREEMEILRAKAANDEVRVKALERQRDIEREKLRIMQEQGVEARAALAVATKRVDLERQAADAAEAAKRAKDQRTGREDFAVEMQALQLEAAGRKMEAEALRDELAMRREAVNVAEQLGISEERALDLLRERLRLQDEIKEAAEEEKRAERDRKSRRDGSYRRAPIYKLPGRNIGGRGLSMGALSGPGSRPDLAESERRRRDAERKLNAPVTPGDGLRYQAESLDVQKQMLKVFTRLGVI